MTWTKIDRAIRDDPRLVQIPRGARLLHVEALTWCNDWGQDGDVPRWALPKITDEPDPEQAAELLVQAGIWETTADGWAIPDFLDHQPSAADVKKIKDANAERQRRQRQHKAGDHSGCDPKYCRQSSRVTVPVTNAGSHDTPYRPVPTRAVRHGEGTGQARPPYGASAPTGGGLSRVSRTKDSNGDTVFGIG